MLDRYGTVDSQLNNTINVQLFFLLNVTDKAYGRLTHQRIASPFGYTCIAIFKTRLRKLN